MSINPYIQMNTKAINKQEDLNDPNYDPNLPLLFDVFLMDKGMKISLVVKWNTPDTNPEYAFSIVKIKKLYLDGFKKTDGTKHSTTTIVYPGAPASPIPNSEADVPTVSNIFKDILTEYGVTLNSVETSDYKSFTSTNFTIETSHYSIIKNLVNEKCQKVKHDSAYIS